MKNVLFVFLMLGTFSLVAQEPAITSSPEMKKGAKTSFWKNFLGQDETGYYLLFDSNPTGDGRLHLEKYNSNLEFVFAKIIDQGVKDINSNIMHYSHKTMFKNGKIYMFLDGWERDRKKGTFLVKTIDSEGNISDQAIKLDEESAKNIFKTANHWVRFSPDGSKFVVLTEKPRAKKENEKIRLQVFSSDDFSNIWKKDLTLETPARKNSETQLAVNNDGTVYLYKIKKEGKKNYVHKLHCHGANLEQVSTIDMKGREPREEQLRFDQDGNFVIHAMMYPPDKFSKGGWSDTWYFVADKEGKVVTNQIEPLGKDFFKNIIGEKKASKSDDLTLSNMYLKEVLPKSDGGFYLMTERRTQESEIVNINTKSYNYKIEYDGAYVFSYDAQGKRLWENFIPVRQKEKSSNAKVFTGSYAYRIWEEKVHMIWNYTNPIDDTAAGFFGSTVRPKKSAFHVLMTVIDKDGKVITENPNPFKSNLLPNLNAGGKHTLAIDPSFFLPTDKGMVLLSRTNSAIGMYYKLTEISF